MEAAKGRKESNNCTYNSQNQEESKPSGNSSGRGLLFKMRTVARLHRVVMRTSIIRFIFALITLVEFRHHIHI